MLAVSSAVSSAATNLTLDRGFEPTAVGTKTVCNCVQQRLEHAATIGHEQPPRGTADPGFPRSAAVCLLLIQLEGLETEVLRCGWTAAERRGRRIRRTRSAWNRRSGRRYARPGPKNCAEPRDETVSGEGVHTPGDVDGADIPMT